jgi:hypothetical protein
MVLIMEPNATAKAIHSATCTRWIAKISLGHEDGQTERRAKQPSSVEALMPLADPWGVASLTEAEKLEAMECFLQAENDRREAAFGGAVRLDVSQTFAKPRVSLAALYAISYLYSGHYDHASAVALRGEDASYTDTSGNYVTKTSAIRRAFTAYREWFSKVRQLGLAGARESGLQPLDGSGLRWY